MAYRRRRTYKKRVTMRWKRYGYRTRTAGVLRQRFRNFMPTSLSIRRNCLRGPLTQATTDQLGGLSFSLGDLTNYTEFTNLFDFYKITGVKLIFIPQFNTQSLSAPGVTIMPKFFIIIDKNDVTAAANINEMREYPNIRVIRGVKTFKVFLKPSVNMSTTSGAIVNSGPRWISTTNTNVAHYGIKYAIDAGGGAQTNLQRWDVECVYYMKFKQPK